jgi:5-methyltetrahydrofolate--homocysteine methyltransferase
MSDTLKALRKAVVEGEDEQASSLAEEAINEGVKPLDIMNESVVAGMQDAGELWKRNVFFQSDIIMSVEAFRAAMGVVEPRLPADQSGASGKILIGTVAGDMHDLGKMMVIAMLRAAAFEVVDLGEDVPSQTFASKVKELEPDILGLGCYMTTTMLEMKDVIKHLQDGGLRDKARVMIGGVPTTQDYADEIGADAWGKDALDAVEKAKQLMEESRNGQ